MHKIFAAAAEMRACCDRINAAAPRTQLGLTPFILRLPKPESYTGKR